MAKGFKHGAGGGVNLNFKVVGNPQPENPKENTIWVNTDEKITGWDFSATEPEAPEEGMVCFITNQASLTSFNALKKNGIQVCPFICYQYVSGEWVLKDAEIYQVGAWNPIVSDLWLYNAGDECTDATGGWIAEAKGYSSDAYGGTTPSVTRNESSIYAVVGGGVGGIFYASKKIDLTNFSRLVFDGAIVGANGWGRLCIWPDFGSYWTENIAAQLFDAADSVRTLDISQLTGEYYIGFGFYHNSSATMKSLKLEV